MSEEWAPYDLESVPLTMREHGMVYRYLDNSDERWIEAQDIAVAEQMHKAGRKVEMQPIPAEKLAEYLAAEFAETQRLRQENYHLKAQHDWALERENEELQRKHDQLYKSWLDTLHRSKEQEKTISKLTLDIKKANRAAAKANRELEKTKQESLTVQIEHHKEQMIRTRDWLVKAIDEIGDVQ